MHLLEWQHPNHVYEAEWKQIGPIQDQRRLSQAAVTPAVSELCTDTHCVVTLHGMADHCTTTRSSSQNDRSTVSQVTLLTATQSTENSQGHVQRS